jgi:signal transduction histidine kinase
LFFIVLTVTWPVLAVCSLSGTRYLTERFFFNEILHYRKMIDALSLTTSLDLMTVAHLLTTAAQDTFESPAACLFILDDKEKLYILYPRPSEQNVYEKTLLKFLFNEFGLSFLSRDISIAADFPLFNALRQSSRPLSLSELLSSSTSSSRRVVRYLSNKKRRERDPLFIPLHAQGMMIAVLVLDDRFQKAYYSGPEFTGIEILLSRFTSLVQNARLTQELALKNVYLEQVNARLTEVDRLKDQFIATTSHELRTPLTAIVGYIEILYSNEERLSPEVQRKFLHRVRVACNELSEQVDIIYDAGQLIYEKERMNLIPTRLNAVVDEAVGMLEAEAMTQQRILHVDVPENISVLVDARLARMVLLNLLNNAFKYSAAGTPIHVTGTLQPDMVTLSVKDNGLGIPPGSQILFERFVRLDRDLNSPVRGAGLGLAICKQLIEAMGGRIWFESSGIQGEGSTFFFTLPLYSGEEEYKGVEGVQEKIFVSPASPTE